MSLSNCLKNTVVAFLLMAAPAVSAEEKAIQLDAKQKKSLELLTLDAAREGDLKTIQSYLDSGFSPNITSKRGDSLLILATYYGHAKVTEALLKDKKTEVNLVNKMGFSALTGAAFRGRDAIVKMLIKHGAEVNQVNNKGQTALMFAAMFGQEGVVATLIAHGADPALLTHDGKTAANLATEQGHSKMKGVITEAVVRKKKSVNQIEPKT